MAKQIHHIAQNSDHGFGGKLQCLESLERLRKRLAPNNHAVVLKNHTIRSLAKLVGNVSPELLASRKCISREAGTAADAMGLVKQARVRRLSADAECYKRDGMSMNNRANIWPCLIYRLMKWKL